MSYQVIARKWRPQTFEEVTGQEVITQTLRNAIEHDRLHHAYLFSGARGVGKTTTARILAKAVNCHKFDAPTATPCKFDADDICSSCSEIAESRSIDVIEIDAASHTGIDAVRETILDSINFNPARDRYKVFIIDEVHQLSKPAFNALLKTLEEPPAKVLFVMATTEQHKVPDTILSRCQEFEFRTIPLAKIKDRLRLIATAEKLDVDESAITEIARSGLGSMRDAQSNFDQVISFSADKITSADVSRALGIAGIDVLTGVTQAIANDDRRALLTTVDDLISRGHDLRHFCHDLISFFRDLLVFKVAGDAEGLLDGAVMSPEQMATIADKFTTADLIRYFNSVCHTESELREATHSRYVLEVGLVKLVEFRSVTAIENILAELDRLDKGSDAAIVEDTSAKMESPRPAEEKKTPKLTVEVESDATVGTDFEKAESESDDDHVERPDDALDAFLPDPKAYIPRQMVDPPIWLTADVDALPGLAPEFVSHFDDVRLDERFEFVLEIIGESSASLASIGPWLDDLYGKKGNVHDRLSIPENPVPVARLEIEMPANDDEPDRPLPILTANATYEELVEYADLHPRVRKLKRMFGAEVIDVKRKTTAKFAVGRD